MLRENRRQIFEMSFIVLMTSSVSFECEAAAAEDPVGTWKLNFLSPDGNPRECIVTIAKEGKTLKGSCTTAGVKLPVKDTAFNQGILSVRVDGEYVGHTYELIYKGKPVGNTLDGTLHWSYGWASGRLAFKGERIVRKFDATPLEALTKPLANPGNLGSRTGFVRASKEK